MNKKQEIFVILCIDFFSVNLSWLMYYLMRIESRLVSYEVKPDLWIPMIVMYIFWLLVFLFFGLYRSWSAKSRVDELATVLKATISGCLFLFFLIFMDDRSSDSAFTSRGLMLIYWGILSGSIGIGRLTYRSGRRRLLENGVGVRNALIVGLSDKAKDLFSMVSKYPALGYTIVGFVGLNEDERDFDHDGVKKIGAVKDLPAVIREKNIKDLLIALESHEHDRLIGILEKCSDLSVSLKILPDMYDIISGQARTHQIYGFPLVEIMPEIMQPWEESMKRLMDLGVSLAVLLFSSPLWLFIGAAIKLNSKGPVLYSQERVGKEGKNFKMHKFRSMRSDAEKNSGPVWAPVNDTRVTTVGRFLRSTRLDEIPQFINVLEGHMSLVGPRPERPYFVEKLSKEIPFYMRRLKVRPGITGWAQVKQGYDQTIEDVKSKVRYDLFYIENMSIRMDIKIIIYTVYVMITGKGQ